MTELKLDGLQCANCAVKIEKALQDNDNFSNVTLSFATRKLVLDSPIDFESLQSLVQSEVDKIEDGITVKTEETEHKKSVKELISKHGKAITGAMLLALVLLVKLPDNFQLALYMAAYILAGGDIAWRAFKNILKGKFFDENFLMALATAGAFALGEYTEAVAVMLFYKTGEAFQEYAVDYSRRSIKSLLNIKAEYANLIKNETTVKVEPLDLNIGDVILVLAGEKIPVDGIIIKGKTNLNTSALNGESIPRAVKENDEVLSGFINMNSPLTIKVTKIFEDSAVSRILHLVENATGKKAPTEQFITKFARVYTPIVVIGALLLACLPPLLAMGDFKEWISRALIFLVISCPCALVLSVPLGFFGGLGSASRKGILIKGGNYLEALNNIDTVVFDKTGTLTKGNFAIERYTDRDTLRLASLLENQSNHPIARSIIKAFGEKVDHSNVNQIEEIPGMGLCGQYKNKTLLVGNKRLMEKFSIQFSEENYAGSVVYVAFEGLYQGAIFIRDEIKSSVTELSARLKSDGIKEVVMLTGDQKNIAEYVGNKLNMDEIYSELLPEDKMHHLEAMIDSGKKVLFVGDGINDAPVLARADIGVAMGGLGSDAAIEASDIVFMTDDPSKLLDARKIAGKTRKIVTQNILFALGIKLFFLTLGALGHANMYEAIFADVGVALLAVLNSMRILK